MSSRAMKLAVLNTAHLHWTKNDLASGVRQSSAEIMNALLVESIDEYQKSGDPVSADILTHVSKAVDQLLWRVEAHQIPLQSRTSLC